MGLLGIGARGAFRRHSPAGPGRLPRPGLPQIRTCGFPASGSSATRICCTTAPEPIRDYRGREGEALHDDLLEALPRHAGLRRAAIEPLAPDPHHLASEA